MSLDSNSTRDSYSALPGMNELEADEADKALDDMDRLTKRVVDMASAMVGSYLGKHPTEIPYKEFQELRTSFAEVLDDFFFKERMRLLEIVGEDRSSKPSLAEQLFQSMKPVTKEQAALMSRDPAQNPQTYADRGEPL